MKFLLLVTWTILFGLTMPIWVLLAALEVVARPVRWCSRACVWCVRPVVFRWMAAIHAVRPARRTLVEAHRESFLRRVRRARRGVR